MTTQNRLSSMVNLQLGNLAGHLTQKCSQVTHRSTLHSGNLRHRAVRQVKGC